MNQKYSGLIIICFLIAGQMFFSFAQDNMQSKSDETMVHDNMATQLKQKANKLALEAYDLYRQLQYDDATERLNTALSILVQLYPENKFPNGHPDIVLVLNNLASIFYAQGKYEQARMHFEKVLEMDRHLYSGDASPNSQSQIAASLNNLGAVLVVQGDYDQARTYREEALEINKRLYPKVKFPHGHPSLATALNNLGFVIYSQGDYELARNYYEQGCAMRRRLYEPEKTPEKLSHVAMSFNNLGMLFTAQGETEKAKKFHEKALTIREQLYSKEKYPQGHPELIMSLNNLAGVLKQQGDYEQAHVLFKQSLKMCNLLYPSDQYPQGHPDIALGLNNLGFVAHAQRNFTESKGYFEKALSAYSNLYPPKKYPKGHPDIAMAMNNLGSVLLELDDKAPAREYLESALAMRRNLYPEDIYKSGHPELASSLKNTGIVFHTQENYDDSVQYLENAARMNNQLAVSFFTGVSEAEALNFAAYHLTPPNYLISDWRYTNRPINDLYSIVWTRKGAIQRLLTRRQQVLSAEDTSKTSEMYQYYLKTRRELSKLALHRADPDIKRAAAKSEKLKILITEKEKLERDLADKIPDFQKQLQQHNFSYVELIQNLPENSVFIDLLQYTNFSRSKIKNPAKKNNGDPSYVAFVLRPGSDIVMIDMFDRPLIDEAVVKWREEIANRQRSTTNEKLRKLIWEPIEKSFPKTTKKIYICPDGFLTRLPWEALPGKKKNTVLIERYSISILPYGQFLMEQHIRKDTKPIEKKRILVVGDVNYDARPEEDEKTLVTQNSGTVSGNRNIYWQNLPGTKRELEILEQFIGNKQLIRLDKNNANTGKFLNNIRVADWAHLATHGFFADEKIRSALKIDEKNAIIKNNQLLNERTTVYGRNPLVLSGLVLAGANLPQRIDDFGIPIGDDGILSAEAIAGLPLFNMELVVLSACESGLGEVAAGEGVFSLQRAFHIAGAQNVVASLWKVNDEATVALMKLFYHKLWVENKKPGNALREAKLYLYLNPEQIESLANDRGPDFSRLIQLKNSKKKNKKSEHSDVKDWASFVLSGAD